MKKMRTMIAMMMAVVSLCVVSTSCSKDDDTPPAMPAAKSIEGTYRGSLKIEVMKSESSYEDIAFKLVATDDATVNITMDGFGKQPMATPQLTIEGVKVTGTDGKYVLAETEFAGTTEAGKQYKVTLKGDFTNNTLTVEFVLLYGAMPMPMNGTYTAPKQ